MKEPIEAFCLSKIFRDRLEFLDRCARLATGRTGNGFQAVIEVVVNKRLLCFVDCAFDGVKLLCQVETGTAALDHGNDLLQMTVRAAQALDDLRVGLMEFVDHIESYPPGGVICK